MKSRFCLAWLTTLCLALAAVGASASAANPQSVSLDEAIALAFERSPALTAARLAVEEAEVGLAQAEAGNLIQPDPTSLLQARRRLDIAQLEFSLAQFDLKLEVEEAFYGVLRAENLLRIVRDSVELAQRQLDIARDKFDQGAHTQADVLNAVSQLAEMEANLAQLEGGFELAMLNFRRALGVGFADDIQPGDATLEFAPRELNVEADIAFALARRIEVLQVETGIEAAKKGVELASNEYTPPLALASAELALRQLENQKERLLQGIELDVRQAAIQVNDAARRIATLAKRLEVAEENVRIAERLYDVDMAPFTQVMGAQVALAQAQADYVHAIFDYNLASAKYDRAVARPLDQGANRQ